MTAPIPDDPFQGLPTRQSRVSVELVALVLVLAGAAAMVVALWAFDWRVGLLALGAAVAAGGALLGSSTEGV